MDILNAIWCALIKVFNAIVEHILQTVVDAIAWVFSIFPSSPLPDTVLDWGDFGKNLGYFVPVSTFVQHFTVMLALMLIWYSYEYIMRWIKMIK